ncbi:cuticle protein 19-like [Anopheles aquasalis]|uniref:cuticle protein 19-like n=1 Tax=Anopheles aquasalis TaxID=42839 RepID=UPI00215B3D64|nr:cuticle protein 19-like [Anopheles aquasalis]
MKLSAVLLVIVSVCQCLAKNPEYKELRKSVAYETKIYHKIPEHTIVEEKELPKKELPFMVHHKLTKKGVDESAIPNYEFGYGVKDPISGDHKDQWEKRTGDKVKGGYRFDESDGTQRVVEYEADGKRGFEATVKNVERKEGKELEEGTPEETSAELKQDKVAHSYSYLKRTGY